jgi:hypothetical protein
MAIIKETKYLMFESTQFRGRKTKVIDICNKSSGHPLGTIEWYSSWKQYCFMPSTEIETVWNNTCLQDVMDVISELMNERRIHQIMKPGRELFK